MKYKLAIIGDFWREEEEKHGKPFVGTGGRMLDTLLRAAGIDRADCFLTNVFNERPESNDVTKFFGPKSKGITTMPALRASKYILPEFEPHLTRLREEIATAEVSCVVALGGTALWSQTGYTNLGVRRGAWHEAARCIPTYHPDAILRQYTWFPLAVSDLWKAGEVGEGRLSLEQFKLIPRPTFEEVLEFCAEGIKQSGPIVFDIETSPKFRAITCIGLGHSGKFMCIPLSDEGSKGFSFWETAEQELEVLNAIKAVLETPNIPKIAHHASYDITWLYTILGIRVSGAIYDTRIIHHSLLPELPHGLGSIGATYFLLPPWKALRKAAKDDQAE